MVTRGFVPGTTHFSVALGDDSARYRFVGLDSNDGADTGVLPAAELEFLEAELAKGDATIPLFHPPASEGALIGLDPADAKAFREVLARHDNTAGVYAGHTHRNQRSLSTETGPVPFFEGGAVKEYPGGYTVVRMHEGGYMVNFWKTSTAEARAWSERSRGAIFGLAPTYQLGSLGDRNWVYDVDARRVSRARPAPPAGAGPGPGASGAGGSASGGAGAASSGTASSGTASSRTGGVLAATGGASTLALAGTAAAAAGLALSRREAAQD